MSIISVRDNGSNRWKTNTQKKNIKGQRSDVSYCESMRAKCFCCAFEAIAKCN